MIGSVLGPGDPRLVTVDFYAKAVAAAVSALLAAAVIISGPRRPVHQILAFFLILIAGNQGFEALRTVAAGAPREYFWARMATVFSSLDPLLLFYFASIYPVRNRLNAPRSIVAVGLAATAFAASASIAVPYITYDPPSVYRNSALLLFTAAVYTVVWLSWTRAVLRGPSEPALRPLVYAMGLAAVPIWWRTAEYLGGGAGQALGWPAGLGQLLLPVLAIGTGVSLVVRWAHGASTDPSARRLARRASLVGIAFAVIGGISSWGAVPQAFGLAPPLTSAGDVGVAADASRWIAFSVLLSVAVLRFQMLGLSLTARRRMARGFVASVVFLAAVLAVLVAQSLAGAELGFRPLELAVLIVAVAASQGFRIVVDRAALSVYGVPLPGDAASSEETYRLAAAQAAASGRDPTTDPELARLREELGIQPRRAATLARMAQPPSADVLSAGRSLASRYTIVRLLGRGGSGRAFLARDELLRRDVVVKEVPHVGARSEDAALQEARVAGGFAHPSVVTVHDILRGPGVSFLITEHVPGGSLADHVVTKGPLPLGDGLRLLDGVLAGLEAVHARGIVHRDLKPANVLLQATGAPKIADFGVARVRRGVTAGFAEGDVFRGTPDFTAPEVLRGGVATVQADLYALGLVARRCIAEPLPPPVESVVARALAEDPSMRWPSAAAMRSALAEATRTRSAISLGT